MRLMLDGSIWLLEMNMSVGLHLQLFFVHLFLMRLTQATCICYFARYRLQRDAHQ